MMIIIIIIIIIGYSGYSERATVIIVT